MGGPMSILRKAQVTCHQGKTHVISVTTAVILTPYHTLQILIYFFSFEIQKDY